MRIPQIPGKPRRLCHVAAAPPENCSQDAPAIQRITGKQIKNRQQQIPSSDQKKHDSGGEVTSRVSDLGAAKSEYGKKKTGGRASDSDAKFRARILRRAAHSGQAAEGMKHDLFDLDAFGAGHERMR